MTAVALSFRCFIFRFFRARFLAFALGFELSPLRPAFTAVAMSWFKTSARRVTVWSFLDFFLGSNRCLEDAGGDGLRDETGFLAWAWV